MAWITIPGLAGKVYVPDNDGQQPKKHPCPTCIVCQWCDETRCRVCRGGPAEADTGGTTNGCGRHKQLPAPKLT